MSQFADGPTRWELPAPPQQPPPPPPKEQVANMEDRRGLFMLGQNAGSMPPQACQQSWQYWYQQRHGMHQLPPIYRDKDKKDDDDPWAGLDAQAAFLGPNLWGSPQEDFKLEYVDLEEFLNENDLLKSRQTSPCPVGSPRSQMAPASPPHSQQSSPRQGPPNPPAQPTLPGQPEPARAAPRAANQKRSAPVVQRANESSCDSVDSCGPPGKRQRVKVDFRVSSADLALATAPGVDFDPQTRQFSEEELKPQPMCKKSKKQIVPDDRKDNKYWARREKNNMAAKRSRDARRLKENQIVLRANFLEKENAALREALEEMTRENEALKKRVSTCRCN